MKTANGEKGIVVSVTNEQPMSYTVREVAQMCRTSVSAVHRWMAGIKIRGRVVRLKAKRLGYLWRIEAFALEEFLCDCDPETAESIGIEEEKSRREAEAADRRVRKRVGLA